MTSSTPTSVMNGGCTETFAFDGTVSECTANGGTLSNEECQALCPPSTSATLGLTACTLADAPSTLTCTYFCGTGRRPSGFRSRRPHAPNEIAAHWKAVARLEAASVDAFRDLECDLVAHHAPHALRSRTRRAARDEIVHAKIAAALAVRAGSNVEITTRSLPHTQGRSLVDIAIENAVEGCVRETFGAAIALFQSTNASDEVVRDAMRTIARDESRHAELAWSIERWIMRRLDHRSRARVIRAKARARSSLARELTHEPARRSVLGLPTSEQARAIFDSLRASVWRV
jgi:hypothetical protein